MRQDHFGFATLFIAATILVAMALALAGIFHFGAIQLSAACAGMKAEPLSVCEQATAADKLNWETALGIVVSGAGTIALVVTVFYSARATKAAVLAAEAAKGAIDHAREASGRELRPYIWVENWEYKGIWDDNDHSKIVRRIFRMRWRNLGKTPAKNIKACASFTFFSGDLPSDFSFADTDQIVTPGTLGPNQTFWINTKNLPFDKLTEVARGQNTMHYWTWIEYEGFDPSQRYRSEYYIKISLSHHDPISAEGEAFDEIPGRFNGMDSTCDQPTKTPLSPRLKHSH